MLQRSLLKFWLGASLVWLVALAALSWLGYHEAIFSLPAPGDAARLEDPARLCAEVADCRRSLLADHLLTAVLAGLGVPAGLFLLGLLLVWAVEGPPWRR
ncbi:MAG: hypothetical protein WD100_10035 [Tistlia sp.]|uniref:hypothetical protein n=1 Tax=Tistlia sp. TaxID=3057121 RepID=UPI0034A448CB